ncbi:MAG TPA: hypothetical protein DHW02_07055 [Ktedonobacter sp.]|nr:hypothetical protein [Ktedonobacter sp.]
MQMHFLRHATCTLINDNFRLLIDPMLSPAEAMDPIANAGNQRRIPMVPLPFSDAELHDMLQHIDGVLLTHTHRDHWDAHAQSLLPKQLPIFCQPEDQQTLEREGFVSVVPVPEHRAWKGIEIYRTGGQHGTGELGRKMGPVSGFVLKGEHLPTLYIAGDTIWCPEVQQALEQYTPDIVVLNAGAATYVTGGGPITMNEEDVIQVCRAIPTAQIIAVHMETVNHCLLTRATLRAALESQGLEKQVLIPYDGEILTLSA